MSEVLKSASISVTVMGACVTAAGLPALIMSGLIVGVVSGGVIYYMWKDSNKVAATAKQTNN